MDIINLSGKEITIKKKDGSFVKGTCVRNDFVGFLVIPDGKNDRSVYIPISFISEIIIKAVK